MSTTNGDSKPAAAAPNATTATATATATAQQALSTASTTTCALRQAEGYHDPYVTTRPSPTVREGDFVLLHFSDGKQIFTQCTPQKSGSKTFPVRINKRAYTTGNLIGLPYGTVLEQGLNQLVPLPASEKLVPHFEAAVAKSGESDNDNNNSDNDEALGVAVRDNRSLVDNNTAQTLDEQELWKLKTSGAAGSEIVQAIIENSVTFDRKTEYSKAKYVARKQKKYQPRCRIVRCNGPSICEAFYLKDPRKVMNLREDTLAQILSYANISAGCQTIVLETCMGIVTGTVAQRMGGYGKILAIYSGQQPSFTDMLAKFNLSFPENSSIKWLHSGDVFDAEQQQQQQQQQPDTAAGDTAAALVVTGAVADAVQEEDVEAKQRDALEWPCVLQAHTRNYIETEIRNPQKRANFLVKRSARFARKLCRQTPMEALQWLHARKSDSVIIVARYDPTETLLALLPYLASSCPFVVFCEFMEPLTECFRELQKQELAINMRLSDTWMREYQVLPGRTHPNMNMSQSGGFILTGVKLDPDTGRNELSEDLLKEIREQIGGRRGRTKNKHKNASDTTDNKERAPKRRRVDDDENDKRSKRLQCAAI